MLTAVYVVFLYFVCGELWKLDQTVPVTSRRNMSGKYICLLILGSCVGVYVQWPVASVRCACRESWYTSCFYHLQLDICFNDQDSLQVYLREKVVIERQSIMI